MGSHSHSLHSVGDWAEVSKLCVLELLLLPALLCGRLVVVTSALCSSLMTLFCSLFPGPLRHIPPYLSLHLLSSLPVGWASSSLQWEASQPNSRHTRGLGDSRRKSWLRLLCHPRSLKLFLPGPNQLFFTNLQLSRISSSKANQYFLEVFISENQLGSIIQKPKPSYQQLVSKH